MTFSVKEIAKRYGTTDKTVLVWIRIGELRATNCSRNITSKKPRYRISDSQLAEFEILRAAPTAPPARRRRKKQSADVHKFY